MLRTIRNFSFALTVIFVSIDFSYAKSEAELELEAKDLIQQLQNLQGVIDEGFGRESHQNDEDLDEMHQQYKDVDVQITQREDEGYYYYILVFSGLKEEINIISKKDSVIFSSKNKAARIRSNNKSQNNHQRDSLSGGFYYAFQILHPNPSKRAEVTREGNTVTIKVKKSHHRS
jgi:hypothetical protein